MTIYLKPQAILHSKLESGYFNVSIPKTHKIMFPWKFHFLKYLFIVYVYFTNSYFQIVSKLLPILLENIFSELVGGILNFLPIQNLGSWLYGTTSDCMKQNLSWRWFKFAFEIILLNSSLVCMDSCDSQETKPTKVSRSENIYNTCIHKKSIKTVILMQTCK